jgi:anti-sigma factor RsiW
MSVARPYLYAAGIILAFLGGWTANKSILSRLEVSPTSDALVAELVDNHVRSLIGEHLTDVRSTDQHTVKPWFAGKADFAPRVVDLTAQGFPLLGGRIDYVRGHTTAALVYGRRRHIVNLFIWRADPSDAGGSAREFNGYSLLHWVKDGLSYWAVSDAASSDLAAFRQAYDAGT